MEHPAIEQQPAVASGSGIPWSEEAETRIRRRIRYTWFEIWGCFVAGLLFAVLGMAIQRWWPLPVSALLFGYGVVLLYGLALATEQLGTEMRRGPRGEFVEGSGMLANKPRSTRGLTEWRQHPASEESFYCSCQTALPRPWKILWWADAQWIPTYPESVAAEIRKSNLEEFDLNAGRYVILCPCGLGHFKLKQ